MTQLFRTSGNRGVGVHYGRQYTIKGRTLINCAADIEEEYEVLSPDLGDVWEHYYFETLESAQRFAAAKGKGWVAGKKGTMLRGRPAR